MTGILFQIISMLAFATANSLWHTPAKKLYFFEAIFYRSVFSTLFFVVLMLTIDNYSFHTVSPFNLSSQGIYIFTALVSMVSYFGLHFFVKGIETSKTGVVATVASISFVISILTSVFVLREAFEPLVFIPILLFGISILLTDYSPGNKFSISKGTKYAVLAGIIWGVTFPLLSIPSRSIGYIQTGLILEIAVLSMSTFFIFIHKQSTLNTGHFIKYLKHFVLLGCLAGMGTLFQNLTYTKLPVHIAGSISSTTHLITIFISWILYKDKLTPHQIAGGVIATTAIIFISFFV